MPLTAEQKLSRWSLSPAQRRNTLPAVFFSASCRKLPKGLPSKQQPSTLKVLPGWAFSPPWLPNSRTANLSSLVDDIMLQSASACILILVLLSCQQIYLNLFLVTWKSVARQCYCVPSKRCPFSWCSNPEPVATHNWCHVLNADPPLLTLDSFIYLLCLTWMYWVMGLMASILSCWERGLCYSTIMHSSGWRWGFTRAATKQVHGKFHDWKLSS